MPINRIATCAECSSQDISGSAVVQWDTELQAWTPFDMVYDIECGDCGDPCSVVWRYEDTEDLVHCPECDRQGMVTEMVYQMFDEGAELVERQFCMKCSYRG